MFISPCNHSVPVAPSRNGSRVAIQALCAAVLCACATAASAELVMTSGNVVVAPGGTANVTLNFDFGPSTVSIAAFDIRIDFDGGLLAFDGPAGASYHGVAVDPAAALNGAGLLLENADTNAYSATWLAMDSGGGAMPPLPIDGTATLTYAFKLLPGFHGGMQSDVQFSFDYTEDAGGGNLVSHPAGTPYFTASSTITASAVPLPASLALLASGLGASLSGARRRPRRRSQETA